MKLTQPTLDLIRKGGEAEEALTRSGRKALKGRLTLELPEQSVYRLENLKEKSEASSYAEVIRRALKAYEALVLETEKGNEIEIVRPDGTRTPITLLA